MKKITLILILTLLFSGCAQGNNNEQTPFPDSMNTATNGSLSTDYPTSTATPDATNTPASDGGTVMYVTANTVNVRKGPSTTADKVTQVHVGDAVTAYEITDKFYRVKLSDGTEGYISKDYLDKNAPVFATPPQNDPTPSPTPSTRESFIGYSNLPAMPDDADYSGNTVEMVNAFNHDIEVTKLKLAQIITKISAADHLIGSKAESILNKWNSLEPDYTNTYHNILGQLEPQGTIFSLNLVSEIYARNNELLIFFEDVYFLIKGKSELSNIPTQNRTLTEQQLADALNSEKSKLVSITNAINDHIASHSDSKELGNSLTAWNNTWESKIYEIVDLKWQMMSIFNTYDVNDIILLREHEKIATVKAHLEKYGHLKALLCEAN